MLKRIIDILLSLLIIISFLPFGLIIIIILNLSGEGEVFYKQIRIGKNGKEFGLIKFATMVKNSPNMGMGDITVKNDPRVLPFGKILRKTKLNEFPQFLNVLIGDMSLVGPRPLLIEYKEKYDKFQDKRHNVKPGITGYSQIKGRNTVSWDQKFSDDIWYVKNQSLKLDIWILWRTIFHVLRKKDVQPQKKFSMERFDLKK